MSDHLTKLSEIPEAHRPTLSPVLFDFNRKKADYKSITCHCGGNRFFAYTDGSLMCAGPVCHAIYRGVDWNG